MLLLITWLQVMWHHYFCKSRSHGQCQWLGQPFFCRALSWNRLGLWSKMIICLVDGIFLCPNLESRMDDASLLYSCSKLQGTQILIVGHFQSRNVGKMVKQTAWVLGSVINCKQRCWHQTFRPTTSVIAFPPKATFNNGNQTLITAKVEWYLVTDKWQTWI